MRDALLKNPLFRATSLPQLLKAQPLGFVDIGARGGTHPLVEPIAAATAVLGFEPDEAECARLKNDPQAKDAWASFDLEPVALWNHDGVVPVHLFVVDVNNSILPVNEAFKDRYQIAKLEPKGKTSVRATTLDNVLFGTYADHPHFGEVIKIDTQGAEYEILEGATRTLDERCVAVVAEIWFCEAYKGAKQFSEVELLMRERGFSFYGFDSLHLRSRRKLNKRRQIGRERYLWADALFLKDPLPGGPRPVSLSDRQTKVLFMFALLLGYYDFALELASAGWAKHDAVEAAAVSALVHGLATPAPEAAVNEVMALAECVRSAPDQALVRVGQFVDRRRSFFDYDDLVLGTG
jgi:FkbM family methyltransferase